MIVLVADDNATNRKLLQVNLEAEKHTVLLAKDGSEAWAILENQSVDAVISDILMPKLDGYSLCYKVRHNENTRHLPFVFFTATYTSSSDETLAVTLGADGFVKKPAPIHVLLESINKVVDRKDPPPSSQIEIPELDFIRDYCDRLIAKLEDKNAELEEKATTLQLQEQRLRWALEQVEMREKKFRALIESSADGIILVDTDLKVIYASPAAEKMLGFFSSDLDYFPPTGSVYPEHHRIIKEFYERLKTKKGESAEFLWRCRSRSGQELYLEGKATNLLHEGAVSAIVVNYRDVTARRIAEAKNREQADLLDKAHEAIVVRDLDGNTIYWNKGAERIYGWDREEILGQKLSTLLYVNEKEYLEAERVLKNKGFWEGEIVETTKSGKRITVFSSWTLIRTEGQFSSVLSISSDISAKLKLEAQLVHVQRLEGLGTLAGGIAHDFNNILMAISGNASLALSGPGLNDSVKETLDEILKASDRASKIVAQILTFSRRQETERRPVLLNPIVADAAQFLKSTLPANIELITELQSGLPMASADSVQIHQVIMNLVTNAAHAMKGKGGQISINLSHVMIHSRDTRLSAELLPGEYLMLTVSDTGTGMEKEIQDRIFDPFFSTKPASEGTGIGLSVVHGIIKSHEGAITVFSEVGKGTIFSIFLPTSEAKDKGGTVMPSEAVQGKGQRILFVDDEEQLVKLGVRVLQTLGYNPTGFQDPFKALEEFKSHPTNYDAVMTDLSMPGMDGASLVKAFHEIRKNIPVIIMTGYIRDEETEQVRSLGIHEVLSKPVSMVTISEVLKELFAE